MIALKILAGVLLFFIPLFTGLITFIIVRFLKLRSPMSSRLITFGIAVGTPAPVLLQDGIGLQPALLVAIRGVWGARSTVVNLLSALISFIVILIIFTIFRSLFNARGPGGNSN